MAMTEKREKFYTISARLICSSIIVVIIVVLILAASTLINKGPNNTIAKYNMSKNIYYRI